ncbi:MAG TPA: DsbA family protein [Chthonomonadaceae bacterium]|nr:DsbA family protein [Chthonomonadaceae bacterium]
MPQLTVAHDVVCPWCWVARRQAERLRAEFPSISYRWIGYELLPEGLPYKPAPPDPDAARKPRIPNRFELFLAAESAVVPKRSRGVSNSRLALEGGEFAWEAGRQEPYLDALYHAYWEEDRDIADRSVLDDIAGSAHLDVPAFRAALEGRAYRDRIVEFDEPAHAAGVWNVATWMFPEEWIAEQTYPVIRGLAARFVAES